jgi:hypothetical protein
MKGMGLTPELLERLERPIIVCLGGSTTDSFLQISSPNGEPLQVATGSWAEELARTMANKKIGGTVFCGGVSGYRTSQDLVKLVRDVLEIKPDIVISYAGVNDLAYRPNGYPIYSRQLYKTLLKKSQQEKLPRSFIFPNLVRYTYKKIYPQNHYYTTDKYYFGVKSSTNPSEYMIRNWSIIHAICNLHNIKFYGVLQPCIGSSELTRNNTAFVENKWAGRVVDQGKWDYNMEQLVRGYDYIINLKNQQNTSDIYDFSTIFDEYDLDMIYPFDEDFCHVSQEGNRIVAESMFQMLFGESNRTQNNSDK